MSTSSGMPAYPSSPSSASRSAEPLPAQPRVVTVAFWLYLLAAAFEVVTVIWSVIAGLNSRARISGVLAQQSNLRGHHIDVGVVLAIGIAVAVVVGVIAIAAFVVFAFVMRRGYGWARIVLLIVTVLSLIGVAGNDGIGAAKSIAAVVATVLVFLKPASEWFRAAKQARIDMGTIR
jgi:hypothetical protein